MQTTEPEGGLLMGETLYAACKEFRFDNPLIKSYTGRQWGMWPLERTARHPRKGDV